MIRRPALLFIALAIALAGCATRPDRTDADLTTRLIGTWQSFESDAAGEKLVLEISYELDGTLHGWFWNHERDAVGAPVDVKVTAHGRWTITGGKIAVTDCVTEPAGKLPSSYTSAEILELNATDLKLRSLEDGSTIVRRKKL